MIYPTHPSYHRTTRFLQRIYYNYLSTVKISFHKCSVTEGKKWQNKHSRWFFKFQLKSNILYYFITIKLIMVALPSSCY